MENVGFRKGAPRVENQKSKITGIISQWILGTVQNFES